MESNISSSLFTLAATIIKANTIEIFLGVACFLLIPSILRYASGAWQGYLLGDETDKKSTGFSVTLAATLAINLIAVYFFLDTAWLDQYIFGQISISIGADALYTQLHFLLFTLFMSILLFRVFYVTVEVDRGALHGSRKLYNFAIKDNIRRNRAIEICLRFMFTLCAIFVFTQVIVYGVVNIESQNEIRRVCSAHTVVNHFSTYSTDQCVREEAAIRSDQINSEFAAQSGFRNSMMYMFSLYILMIIWNILVWCSFRAAANKEDPFEKSTQDFKKSINCDFALRLSIAVAALLSLFMMWLWLGVVCPSAPSGEIATCTPSSSASRVSAAGIFCSVVGLVIYVLRVFREYISILKGLGAKLGYSGAIFKARLGAIEN